MDTTLKCFNNKFLLILIIGFLFSFSSFAQYKAIELSVSASRYLDDNMDNEFEYKSYNQRALGHYILGYSFPISKKILLTARSGVSRTDATYRTNSLFSNSPSIPTSSVVKDKKYMFAHASLAGSYWLKSDYTGLFFTGELWTFIPIYAKSEIYKSELIESSMGIEYEEEFINRDIKDQMQSIVPIMNIGVGYNLKIAYGAHVFANMNLEYRATGYFKNTENITHISRRLTLGLKYVIEKNGSVDSKIDK